MVWRAPVVVTKRPSYIKIANLNFHLFPPHPSTPPPPPPGGAVWYSTPVTNLIICSDPSPRTLVRLPDTPGGAQRPPGAAGERRRGRRPLSGRPGRLREERRFGPGGSKSMFHCLTPLPPYVLYIQLTRPRPGNPLIPPDPDPELFQCECDLCAHLYPNATSTRLVRS